MKSKRKPPMKSMGGSFINYQENLRRYERANEEVVPPFGGSIH